MAFIRIGGRLIASEHVVSIKACGENQTVVHCTGQSAVDAGFLIDAPESEVIERLTQAKLEEAMSYLEAAEAALEEQDIEPVAEPEPESEPEPEPRYPFVSLDDPPRNGS